MLKKSNAVQHFKIKPSQTLLYFYYAINIGAFLIIVFSSIEWWFKILLTVLLLLEFLRQQQKKRALNELKIIEVRDNKIFIKRKRDENFIAIEKWALKQNRIFAEIQLHLKDDICSNIFFSDSFQSKQQFSQCLQCFRFLKI